MSIFQNVTDFAVPQHIKEEVIGSDVLIDGVGSGANMLIEDLEKQIKAERATPGPSGQPGTFWPERPTKVDPTLTGVKANTVLTNLQRGNIPTMQTIVMEPVVQTLHQRAGQGELKAGELNAEMIDERDLRKRTPLMWSAFYGQTPTVNLLLKHGASVKAKGDECETALHLSVTNGHHDVTRILLNHGAEVDALDENACTPLMFASMSDQPHCVNELLLAGADVTLTNINGDTAISLAVRCGSRQAQAVLEQHLLAAMKDLLI